MTNLLGKLFFYFKNPIAILISLSYRNIIKVSDYRYICWNYKYYFHKKIDLKNPQTYNEKLQWLKLYDRNPKYVQMVDKYKVKKYVANIIGDEYIIPTYGIYDNFNQIDFKKLPNQFVIKCTHDSGGLVIVKNKKELDYMKAKSIINKSLKKNYYYAGREWPYKNVKPKIVVEKYMEDNETKELRDYKFFCFDGKVKMMFIASNRQGIGDTYFDFFDNEFNHLPFVQGHPNAPVLPKKPKQYLKMIELAEKLSNGIPHVRVDFYEVNGRIFFGEMTFFHFSGFVPFEPEIWDNNIGQWLKLPK